MKMIAHSVVTKNLPYFHTGYISASGQPIKMSGLEQIIYFAPISLVISAVGTFIIFIAYILRKATARKTNRDGISLESLNSTDAVLKHEDKLIDSDSIKKFAIAFVAVTIILSSVLSIISDPPVRYSYRRLPYQFLYFNSIIENYLEDSGDYSFKGTVKGKNGEDIPMARDLNGKDLKYLVSTELPKEIKFNNNSYGPYSGLDGEDALQGLTEEYLLNNIINNDRYENGFLYDKKYTKMKPFYVVKYKTEGQKIKIEKKYFVITDGEEPKFDKKLNIIINAIKIVDLSIPAEPEKK
jgi:hypothetical protein